MHEWLIGTSGFAYSDWRGSFYPADVPRQRWLEFYAREFPAVELNVTFYRTPRESTYRAWTEATGPAFRFVLKAPRLVSHVRRLAGCREELARFWDAAQPLAGKVAAVLLQLPPSRRFDAALLDAFLGLVPEVMPPLAWEVRNASFQSDEALAWFRRRNQPLVVADSGGRYPTVRAFTAPPAYLRFHGPAELYASRYTAGQLAAYAAWVRSAVPAGTPVYAFFNNDAGGHAIANARQLRALLELHAAGGG